MVEDALAPFLATWTLMMAAMMLPSAAPMILLHRLGADGAAAARELRSAVFAAGYLLVWGSVGIAVWLSARMAEQLIPHDARAIAVAAVLGVAGIYQLTPLKDVCLRACRTPADFLLTHWYRGLGGSFRTGVEHGLYCFGCCWALMAVFVAAGSMSLAWAVVIAGAVLVEKVAPRGVAFGRVIGLVLVGLAALVLVRPELAGTTGGM